jgi:transcriptional regulator with XRE-family HTH domain
MKKEVRFGSRIKELRLERGWSQEHLASITGLDPRTIQRVEKDATKGSEALMAIATAFDLTVGEMGRRYWVAESKAPRGLMIRKAFDFAEAIQRASHFYTYQVLGELRPEVEAAAEPLIETIFADIWAMSPDEPQLVRSWCRGIEEPLQSLRDLGLCIFSLQEKRDVFLRGPDRKPIPFEDCSYCHFVVVPPHAAFHLGGKDSQEPAHRFNEGCDEAVRVVLRVLKEPEMIGFGSTAVHLAMAVGGESKMNWCDKCFPEDEDGLRVGWKYMGETLGLTKDELVFLAGSSDLPIVGLA